MQLYIDDETRIRYLQHFFNAQYPYLKIDFLKDGSAKKFSQKTERVNPNELVKRAGKVNGTNYYLSVNKQRTVAQVKKDLKELFGLTAEVFRKSGNVWIETSFTDDWTLEQQNNEGELLSLHKPA
jgi:hypothetical protein